MASITFDTLKLARRLESAGFAPKQAADTAQALADALAETADLATKADLLALKVELKAELAAQLAEQKAEILKWMFGALAVQTGLIVTLIKLIP